MKKRYPQYGVRAYRGGEGSKGRRIVIGAHRGEGGDKRE